jgi:[ribosomal protein S5]-alanine N-acetyltransferase
VPWPVELFEALPSRESAGAVLGAAVPEGWPDEELQGLLEVYEPRLRNDPTMLGFGPWVAIAAGGVVGSAGFVGRPNERGEVELGYGILEGHRNRGYATEAARALVAWALAQPNVEEVVARSERSNDASNRVLEKLGLTRVRTDGGQARWISPARAGGA